MLRVTVTGGRYYSNFHSENFTVEEATDSHGCAKGREEIRSMVPNLNDTAENLRGLLHACFAARVKGILCFGMGLTLREGNREYFYEKLDAHFPGVREPYERTFGKRTVRDSPNSAQLRKMFHVECRAWRDGRPGHDFPLLGNG